MIVSELEDYTIAFASGVAAHVDVTLAVPARQYAPLARWIDDRVDLRLLDWPRHGSTANLTFVPRMARLVRRERPDVVHLLSNNVLWLNLAAPFWPCPLVTTVHDVEVHPGDRETRVLPEWSTRLIVRQSDHVVVHGEALKERAAALFGRPAGSVHVLGHPAIRRYADLARERGLRRRTSGGLNLLLFGRVYAYKGLEHLVRAEALIGDRTPGLKLVVAGRGDDARALAPLMGDPGRYEVANRFIPDEEVAQRFLDADVVVLPYVEASQSGVLNDAAAFGKPIIVTDVGELRATVEPAGIGLVVPPADPARLADAIVRLAGDPALRDALGRNARRWAEGPNAPEAIGAQAAALYARAARR